MALLDKERLYCESCGRIYNKEDEIQSCKKCNKPLTERVTNYGFSLARSLFSAFFPIGMGLLYWADSSNITIINYIAAPFVIFGGIHWAYYMCGTGGMGYLGRPNPDANVFISGFFKIWPKDDGFIKPSTIDQIKWELFSTLRVAVPVLVLLLIVALVKILSD